MAWNFGPNSFFRPGADDRRYGDRTVWERHLRPPSALALALMVTALALVVAFVTTIVYANIDAGRPLDADQVSATPNVAAVPTTPPEPASGGSGQGGQASGVLTTALIEEKLRESVWEVTTFDRQGGPSQGSAFVVGSFGGRTLMLTSLAVVNAATRVPAPVITVRQGSRSVEATLWTWDESRDLAVLVIGSGSASLPLAGAGGVERGARVYTFATGRSMAPGIVTEVAGDGIEHNILIDDALAGAPLVNQRGEVVAVASLAYNPGGRGTTTVFIGVPIALACERVLSCGGGNTAPTPESPTTTTP